MVRSIDNQVIDLFTRAEASGNGGGGSTGGGITYSSFTDLVNDGQAGALRVIIEPAVARTARAGWRINPEATLRASSVLKTGLAAGIILRNSPQWLSS